MESNNVVENRERHKLRQDVPLFIVDMSSNRSRGGHSIDGSPFPTEVLFGCISKGSLVMAKESNDVSFTDFFSNFEDFERLHRRYDDVVDVRCYGFHGATDHAHPLFDVLVFSRCRDAYDNFVSDILHATEEVEVTFVQQIETAVGYGYFEWPDFVVFHAAIIQHKRANESAPVPVLFSSH